MVVFPKSGLCNGHLIAVLTFHGTESLTESSNAISLIGDEYRAFAAERLAKVQEDLSARLPRHMLPSRWAVVSSLPKLPSTKIDRKAIQTWVTGMSPEVYQQIENFRGETSVQEPSTTMERTFQAICSEVLNRPAKEIALHKSFLQVGGDSISAMALVARCRKEGIAVGIQDLLRSRSLAQVASKSQIAEKSKAGVDVVTDEPFDLSPMQRMHFAVVPEGFNHYNQSFQVALTRRVDVPALQNALNHLVRKHAMLRARFINSSNGWMQKIPGAVDDTYRFSVQDVETVQEIAAITQERQKSLDIVKGPVFSVDLFNINNAEQQLFLVTHHAVIDLISWRIVLQDLEDLLTPGALPTPSSLSFQAWCRLQEEYISKERHPERFLPFPVAASDLDFWGMQGTPNTVGDTRHLSFTVTAELTSMLLGEGCHRALHTEPVDVMLSAISHSFLQVFRQSVPAIYTEGHGREPWDAGIDLSNTVGWFTTMCPLQTNTNEASGLIEVLRQIKDVRRRIPQKGWSYFANRFRKGTEDQVAVMEMNFNYTGLYQQLHRAGSLFRPVQRLSMDDTGRTMPRDSIFDILVTPGGPDSLDFHFTFPQAIRHQEKIRLWVEQCAVSLKATLQQLERLEAEKTLSDFPLLPLSSYDDLDTLIRNRLPKVGIEDIAQVEDIYPLSPVQQGILLSQIKSPGYYETFAVFEVKGPEDINTQQLSLAWQRTVDRHACLRTVFVESISESSPYYQAVLKQIPANIQFVNCDDTSDLVAAFKQPPATNEESPKPVQVARGEHSLAIYSAPQGRTFVKLEISHALTDGTAMGIILRDFCSAYEGKLPPLTKPLYSSYIAYLQSQSTDDSLAYWTSRLANTEPCLFPKLKDSQDDGDLRTVDVQIPASFAAMLRYCSDMGVALSNLFQVAWALVLQAYTGSHNVNFGYLTSGRDVPVAEVEDIVGVFINMLVCSIELAPSSSMQSALETVQTDFMQGLPHQHISLAQIQHALGIQGPLFNTIMSIQRRALSATNTSLVMEEVIGADPTEVSASASPNHGHSSPG